MTDENLTMFDDALLDDSDTTIIELPSEILAGKDQSFIARFKAKVIRYAMEKLLGTEELPTKAPWKSKINAMGIIGAIVAWFMPQIAAVLGIPVEEAYQIFGTIFGGALIAIRTWFTKHLLKF